MNEDKTLVAKCIRCQTKFVCEVLECPVCGNDNEHQMEFEAK